MKTASASNLIKAVKTRIDEIMTNESGSVLPSDDTNLDAIILGVAGDAYRYVCLNCPDELLEGTPADEGTLTMTIESRVGEDGRFLVGVVQLPSDYLRGVSVRVSSWLRAANDFIREDSPEYTMQWDPYARGTWQRPVAAVVESGATSGQVSSTAKTMELFTPKAVTDTLSRFYYVKDVGEIDGTSSVSIPDKLYNGYIYYICYLVLTAIRDQSAAQFYRIANELIGNDNNNETNTYQQ